MVELQEILKIGDFTVDPELRDSFDGDFSDAIFIDFFEDCVVDFLSLLFFLRGEVVAFFPVGDKNF